LSYGFMSTATSKENTTAFASLCPPLPNSLWLGCAQHLIAFGGGSFRSSRRCVTRFRFTSLIPQKLPKSGQGIRNFYISY
ncbi:MAG: hypothetical protein WBE48_07480, partial [Xanthobacteraceae bacterium]